MEIEAQMDDVSAKHNPSDREADSTPEKAIEVADESSGLLAQNQNKIAARRNKEEGKKLTPPNVKVPDTKNFGLLERYKSPTDSIMSPATRVLLARNKKTMRPMELPAYVPPKVSAD
eukprot:TRINITY_DN40583_c0_g1_i1.p1 TRINITY_DN40583_c0_g1~~TRINITY_DN40583_c0_g1_i1.p1  ORF type:complete len:117 (+),score=29.29 TRINITY_DN40583_c0_g1_i1:186-536(+)